MKSKNRIAQTEPSQKTLVYVVDDDVSVRESLGNLMRSVGLDVELFASAADFQNRAAFSGSACLVLDVRLPGMSGLDLQAALSRSGDAIPIVFITGHGDVPMSVRAMKGGALEFLLKPFREQDLLDAIHTALAKPAAANTLKQQAAPTRAQEGAPETTIAQGSGPSPSVAADLQPRQILARNLQLGRAIFNWSQEELGTQCELHRSHISALERAELSVGVDAIDSIAAAFRVPPHVILMPPGQAQSILLESFNGVARKPRRSLRGPKT